MYYLKILVVEDEVIVRKYITSLLEDLYCSVVGESSSGEEAIELARQYKPDLIIMDIKLKGELSGIEAGRKIAEEQSAYFVFMSAYTFNDVREIEQVPGCIAFVDKPPKKDVFQNIINIIRGDENLSSINMSSYSLRGF